ncbi:cytochrome c, 1 heme-binding site [Syntrophotalea carbinolica DSM 2380]|uniref:Cytochrome c, 1 heme-binding site n=1 Tax=Syntrophotalea carbinolica (strain DSM 2380 / NBRC 103641 / GraBd1) TaxID=338963 RepID=Q3A879_SYNC1|nr:FmdE family protein [Syntrophotalea carbinolica]ABA87413.1 cytochrome c, 1 heme-binding site [Syntrophotalea carbinolica DSM 2380]
MKTVFTSLVLCLCAVWLPAAHAGECQKCHASFGTGYMQPKVPAVRVQAAGRTDVITLAGLYGEHGHPCVGTGIAFRAIQIGMRTLYGDTVPQRDDLLVFSQMPGPGVLDAVDRIMQGPEPSAKTVAPAGMRLARENFVFTLMSKASGERVIVKFKPEVLSEDFFPLKARMKKQGLSPEQWQVLHGYIRQAVTAVIREPDARLFDVTRVASQVLWGMDAPAAGDRLASMSADSGAPKH